MAEELDRQVIALVERVGEGTRTAARRRDAEQALRDLYDLLSPRLYGIAVRVVGNRNWAEDVLQETFLHVWRVAGDYRSSLSPPLAWLGLITRSRALDFLRRRASERADLSVELDQTISETAPGDSPDPMETAQASEHAWALHECLRKLERKHRELISLAYFRDLSHSELAEQVKLPLGTVKTWVRRGLDQLRSCMARVA